MGNEKIGYCGLFLFIGGVTGLMLGLMLPEQPEIDQCAAALKNNQINQSLIKLSEAIDAK